MKMHKKGSKEYLKYMAIYLKTKEGSQFALNIMSQLIDGFEVTHNGRIENVHIEDSKPIVLDFT